MSDKASTNLKSNKKKKNNIGKSIWKLCLLQDGLECTLSRETTDNFLRMFLLEHVEHM